MYIPRHWHFALSAGISLLGFYVTQHYQNTYDVVIVFFALQYHAAMHTAYIVIAGRMYQAYVTRQSVTKSDEPIYNHHTGKPVEDVPVQSDGFIPLKLRKVGEPVLLNQVVELPAFDKERNFWISVLRMYDFDPITQKHVNMTEDLWVNTKKQFGQKPLANMKERGARFGLIERKNGNKNSPFIVKSRQAVALVASGNPLPDDPPPPPK
jgi:hypothetical protein